MLNDKCCPEAQPNGTERSGINVGYYLTDQVFLDSRSGLV